MQDGPDGSRWASDGRAIVPVAPETPINQRPGILDIAAIMGQEPGPALAPATPPYESSSWCAGKHRPDTWFLQGDATYWRVPAYALHQITHGRHGLRFALGYVPEPAPRNLPLLLVFDGDACIGACVAQGGN